jgi:hypothetical protein
MFAVLVTLDVELTFISQNRRAFPVVGSCSQQNGNMHSCFVMIVLKIIFKIIRK